MYLLTVYIPKAHLEAVKTALFAAGAGRLGEYESCAWQTLGQGQFKPLPGSDPSLGEIGQIHRVAEYRVEMVCQRSLMGNVIAALRAAHPYEVPAYSFVEMLVGDVTTEA